jgi:hypothetical protein
MDKDKEESGKGIKIRNKSFRFEFQRDFSIGMKYKKVL